MSETGDPDAPRAVLQPAEDDREQDGADEKNRGPQLCLLTKIVAAENQRIVPDAPDHSRADRRRERSPGKETRLQVPTPTKFLSPQNGCGDNRREQQLG